ncbi:keywimysin-related RiPP [Microbacterium sp. UBA3394]
MQTTYVAPTVTPMGSFQQETGVFLAWSLEVIPPIGDWTP